MRTVIAAGLSAADVETLIPPRTAQWRLVCDRHTESDMRSAYGGSIIAVDCSRLDDDVWLDLYNAIARCRPLSIILRTTLARRSCSLLLARLKQIETCRVSVIGIDDLRADVTAAHEQLEGQNSTAAILGAIQHTIPSAVREIVIAAIAVGRRRTTVGTLAGTCNVSVRTIEWRLRAAGYLSAAELLAWALCMHSAWAMEVDELLIKRAASQAGFGNTASFTNYIRRHTASTPAQLRDSEGFAGLTRRFARTVEHHGSEMQPRGRCDVNRADSWS